MSHIFNIMYIIIYIRKTGMCNLNKTRCATMQDVLLHDMYVDSQQREICNNNCLNSHDMYGFTYISYIHVHGTT